MNPRLFLAGCLLALLCSASLAQQKDQDPRIQGILRRISPERLRASVETLVGFGTRHTLSDTSGSARGIGAARRWIRSQFEESAKSSGGRMRVAFERTIAPPGPRIPQPTEIVNVVATLRPANPHNPSSRRIIIIGAHYDSRAADPLDAASDAPGADDDGSGTALVLELARVLSPEKFDATLLFACFAGEEQGLIGSTALAKQAAAEGWNVEAMLNNDIVGTSRGGDGTTDSLSVRLFSQAYSPLDTGSAFARRNSLGLENDGVSRSLARYAAEICERYVSGFQVRMVYRLDRFLRGGDHSPFHQRGFAAVRFTEAKENYDHQHQNVQRDRGLGDLTEYVDFSYLANVARVNAATAASLAFAPAPVTNAGIVTSQLAYDTRLRWNRSPGPGTTGYLVRWRRTNSPSWEHSLFTGDTTLTVTASKDDCLFGIQSVNDQGNAGLVVVPLPVR